MHYVAGGTLCSNVCPAWLSKMLISCPASWKKTNKPTSFMALSHNFLILSQFKKPRMGNLGDSRPPSWSFWMSPAPNPGCCTGERALMCFVCAGRRSRPSPGRYGKLQSRAAASDLSAQPVPQRRLCPRAAAPSEGWGWGWESRGGGGGVGHLQALTCTRLL